MKLEYIGYSFVATQPIDDERFTTIIAVTFKLAEDKNNLFGTKTEQIEVEQSNNMTGYEMDKQCEQESINFVEKLSNQ
jgi:hypothetical protein